jgi:hypothetical protein
LIDSGVASAAAAVAAVAADEPGTAESVEGVMEVAKVPFKEWCSLITGVDWAFLLRKALSFDI